MSCNYSISKLLDIQDISECSVENVGEEKHIHIKHINLVLCSEKSFWKYLLNYLIIYVIILYKTMPYLFCLSSN